jgi:uncharacterized protein YciI
MAKAANDDAKTLLARMMRKELYVILNTTLVSPAKLQSKLAAHLAYMIDLEKRGILFASGPLTDSEGNLTGDGLTIVRAKSHKAAQGIADGDPFVRAEMRKAEVKRWIVNEGRITVQVDLSDCRGYLD